ncbi:MAG TPA: sigma-70 family RNA polymerase sigma factor [Solirubrobacterales bacterium]
MAGAKEKSTSLGEELARVRFGALYRDQGRAILSYALCRVDDPDDAPDVVADTFLVAWRRLDDVPVGPRERLWLYAVARRVIANLHRSTRRRTRLAERLAESLRTEIAAHPAPEGASAEILEAIAELGEENRELLLLVSWEGLSPAEAGRVLGISALAARSRLHRARRRLRALLDERGTESHRGSKLDLEEAR